MNNDEAQKFILLKHHKDAITLRKYDDEGKIPNMKIKNINDYKELITSHLLNQQT
jgi:predicted HD phosphohydrolase